jgi:hypothetical protein
MPENYQCDCDCDCTKEMNEPRTTSMLNQCDDCDDGIHWDGLHKRYVNYDEVEAGR